MCPKGLSKKHLFEALTLLGPLDHQGGIKIALTFLFGLVDPDDPTRSYNPLWCVLGLGGIGNESSDYALWVLLPSYLVI